MLKELVLTHWNFSLFLWENCLYDCILNTVYTQTEWVDKTHIYVGYLFSNAQQPYKNPIVNYFN